MEVWGEAEANRRQPRAARSSEAFAPHAIRCVECGRFWEDPGERWRVYVLLEAPQAVPVPYCPVCAEREFGPPGAVRPP